MMRVEHLAYQFLRNGQLFFKDVSFQLKSPGVNFDWSKWRWKNDAG